MRWAGSAASAAGGGACRPAWGAAACRGPGAAGAVAPCRRPWGAAACGEPVAAEATAPPGGARGSGLLAPPLQRLVSELSKLPGIGNRTAQRLAFHVLRASAADANALADAIREVKERITLCEVCFNLAEGPRCTVCLDERRDGSVLCVVEEPADVIPIERTHEFRGRYHVLGGALSPIDGVEPEDLRIGQLYARLADPVHPDAIREVILATNPTTTGEA